MFCNYISNTSILLCRCSPKTILTYCTNGVLLRTLMGSSNSLSRVTHLIIDEVHDRDRLSDFILITIRNYLVKYPDLRLILMSATIDTNLFSSYFNNCPVINVPGKLFDVKQYFLEDILKNTRYMSDAMVKNQRRVTKQIKNLKIDAFDINQMTMGLMDDNPQVCSHSYSTLNIVFNIIFHSQYLISNKTYKMDAIGVHQNK